MKRSIIILLCTAVAATSCTLLTQLTAPTNYNGSHSGTGVTESVVTTNLFAPMAGKLTATEDRGTGLYGYLNEFGMWAIQPQFRNAYSFNSDIGIAVVQLQNYRWGAINALGQIVINFNFRNSSDVYSAVNSIQKGRYCGIDLWVVEDPVTELYGYLDYYGNWYIAPQFPDAYGMSSDGFAVVRVASGQWGAIDRNGNFIIQPNFNSSSDAYSALNSLLRR